MDVLFICYELQPSTTEADEAKVVEMIKTLFPTHWNHSARTWIVLPDSDMITAYNQLSHYLPDGHRLLFAPVRSNGKWKTTDTSTPTWLADFLPVEASEDGESDST